MNLCRVLPLSGVLCAGVIHAASIDLSGAIYDRAGKPLAGVVVSIPDSGWVSTTNARGEWHIDGATAGVSKAQALQQARWNGHGVEVNLLRPATVSVEVFDLQGARSVPSVSTYLGKGGHELPLKLDGAPGAVAFVRLTIEGKQEVLRVGSKIPMSSRVNSDFAGRSADASPRLRVTRNGRVEVEFDASGVRSSIMLDTSTAYTWNDSLVYTGMCDMRDGQVYRTIQIGNLTWMAENLNYRLLGTSWLRSDDSAANGAVYGRFYTQAAFQYVAADSCLTGAVCQFPAKPQGVCPAGWRVPTEADWQSLEKTVLAHPDVDSASMGEALAAKGGSESWPAGRDLFGFRALPGGIRFKDGAWSGAGWWWTATKHPAPTIFEWHARELNPGAEGMGTTFMRFDINPSSALAARCVSP